MVGASIILVEVDVEVIVVVSLVVLMNEILTLAAVGKGGIAQVLAEKGLPGTRVTPADSTEVMVSMIEACDCVTVESAT